MLNSQIGREWKKLNFLIRNAGFQPPYYLQKIFDDNQGGKLVGPPREAPVTSIPCKTTEAFTKKHVFFLCVCVPLKFPRGNCKAVTIIMWI